MNVVDSSAWLEDFADGPNADEFAGAIQDTASLAEQKMALADSVILATARAHEGLGISGERRKGTIMVALDATGATTCLPT